MNQDKGQLTILLVDASSQVMDRHALLLQEMGLFNNLQAENGSEAMAMVNNFAPDLIIANQNTPVINGLSLLRLVRQKDATNSTVFIIYGEGLSGKLLAQAGRAGVNTLIQLPSNDQDFKSQISQAIDPPKDAADEKADELLEKSVELIEAGEYETALDACEDILEIHESAEVYFNMGYIKSMQGKFEEALACFRKATVINGHHAKAYQQMGLIYQKMGQNDKAQKYLEQAAEIHLEQHQDQEAEEIFNTVLALRPHTTNVYNSLGIIYRRQKRFEESIKAYEKAIKVHPNDEHVYFNAARAYLDLKNIIMAQKMLRKAVEINPTFKEGKDLLRATELGLNLDT